MDLDVLPNAQCTQFHGKWAEKDRNFGVTLMIEPVFMRATREGVKIMVVKKALGDKAGIKRYGYFILPMDEVLALCAADLSGRPYFKFDAGFTTDKLGTMDTEMVKEFFYAVSYSAQMNLHLKILDGGNNHHMAEALFKAFGKALDMAVSPEPRMTEIWSTKGAL